MGANPQEGRKILEVPETFRSFTITLDKKSVEALLESKKPEDEEERQKAMSAVMMLQRAVRGDFGPGFEGARYMYKAQTETADGKVAFEFPAHGEWPTTPSMISMLLQQIDSIPFLEVTFQ